ncbi:MAG: type II toxin-antitoxin system VapC family toxin [Acidobacteria bacterium]|nr:type II toxin-antitoxin system VapC family toxin [Acidobacteriota bacterium]MBI3421533.1 type II toxin-antitoxin system VapC family toxin [Acidobacteriota bacterium]
MNRFVFVDTGAWFALAVPSDPNHRRVSEWLANAAVPLLTTDYVIDETLTLLRARGERRRALELGEAFFSGRLAEIYWLSETDLYTAWQVFRDFADKDWSFTDCTSRVVIQKLDLATALAFDRHFQQFGNVIVVP